MPFTTTPKAPATPAAPQAENSPRARAIAKFNQGLSEASKTDPAASESPVNQAQTTPVQNASKVAPEEMGALKTQSEQGQNDTVEPPKEPVATEPKKAPEEPLSTQFAILARKEKAHRNQVLALQADMKAKEAALTAREEAIKAKEAEYQTNYIPKSKLTENLWDTLAEQGITYDQVTQEALNRQNQDPTVRAAINKLQADMKAELQAMKDAQERSQKAYQEQQTQQYQQAIQNITAEVKNLVTSDEKFELVKNTNSVSDVVELIERSFKEGISDEYPKGVIIPTEVAAQMVEDYLLDEAMKISSLKKIQSRLKPPAATQQAETKLQSDQKQPQMKTITNSVGTNRPLTARERAILAFKGELKN